MTSHHSFSLCSFILTRAPMDAEEIINVIFESQKPQDCAIAFSGGKESVVLLHLIDKVIKENPRLSDGKRPTLVMFCEEKHKASAMADALLQFTKRLVSTVYSQYDFDIVNCTSIKEGISSFQIVHPRIKTFFMGTRLSDSATLASIGKAIVANSSDWPAMVRVMPLFFWSYNDVWAYIDRNDLLYPLPYTQGYTSLSQGDDCRPNPLLRKEDGSFAHARELKDKSTERKDRV